jgi:hypothetical protein
MVGICHEESGFGDVGRDFAELRGLTPRMVRLYSSLDPQWLSALKITNVIERKESR